MLEKAGGYACAMKKARFGEAGFEVRRDRGVEFSRAYCTPWLNKKSS